VWLLHCVKTLYSGLKHSAFVTSDAVLYEKKKCRCIWRNKISFCAVLPDTLVAIRSKVNSATRAAPMKVAQFLWAVRRLRYFDLTSNDVSIAIVYCTTVKLCIAVMVDRTWMSRDNHCSRNHHRWWVKVANVISTRAGLHLVEGSFRWVSWKAASSKISHHSSREMWQAMLHNRWDIYKTTTNRKHLMTGVPNLLFPMYPLSISTHEHVSFQHFDRWTMNMYS